MLWRLIARARSLWQGVRRGTDLDAEMHEEFRLHMELRAADLVRQGIPQAEALRRARLEFGSIEQYKDEGRKSRGLRRFDDLRVSWLDFKLGARMLVKYPGLTLVGGLAVAFAIWIGAGTFELVTQVLRPTLPLAGGDRIVAIRMWDAQASRVEAQVLHDFAVWREQLETVEQLGAYRTLERNLITGDGRGEPVEVAEISASGFRVASARPLLGRALVEVDEQPGAAPVIVIGHDVWQRRFGGDSGIVGRSVRLARQQATIVGVMPEGFGFPVAQSLWIPLRLSALDYARRQGPSIQVFGRLAPGATLDEAQAELTTLGRRAAADFPSTHEHLRPQVMPYAKSIVNLSGWRSVGLASVNVPLVMLLVLVCGNVALLMFARAATREREIAVRSALGATRGRIVMQLFAEALVLGGVAAAVGLAAARTGVRWVMHIVELEVLEGGRLPFWFGDSLSLTTVLYAVGLTILGAVIMGVVPALKVTGSVGTRLKQVTAGGGGLRFGGVWTVVVVSQVAVTVAFPAVAFVTRNDAVQIRSVQVGFPAEQYLSVRLEMDREPPAGGGADSSAAAFRGRFRRTYEELGRRLAADPAVAGIAFAERLPRMYHPGRLIEVDAGGAAPLDPNFPGGYRVSSAAVEPDYFDVLEAPPLVGRRFQPADHESEQRVVIVNRSFVDLVLGGRNAIGRRIRYVHREEWDEPRTAMPPEPWYEIVGVVRDMGMGTPPDPKVAGIYHPVAPGGVYPAHMAVRVRGSPEAFAPRLRALATATDPTLRLYGIGRLDKVSEAELKFIAYWFRLLLAVSAVALVLSLAAIYSVMAFTVARRTREIGVRVALGADARRVVAAIFARPLAHVTLGIVVGGVLVWVLRAGVRGGAPVAADVARLLAYAAVMFGVCLLACVVPTRRALRVEPTEALRADG